MLATQASIVRKVSMEILPVASTRTGMDVHSRWNHISLRDGGIAFPYSSRGQCFPILLAVRSCHRSSISRYLRCKTSAVAEAV